MLNSRLKWRPIAALLCLTLAVSQLRAAEGITVSASGEVKSKPTVVEIGATVNAEAELTADAIVKYREAKKKGMDAITNLKLPNLTIDSNGFTVNSAMDAQQQQRMMQGMGAGQAAKQKVEVTEQLKLVVKNVDKMEPEALMDTLLKIIDTGKDAGLVIGPPPVSNYYEMQIRMQSGRGNSMVSFKLGDVNAMKEQAYKQAMDSASAKAKRLAELAGVKLGRVVLVQEGQPKDDSQQQNMARAYMYGMPIIANEQTDVSSNLFTDIPVKVVLTVQFEIIKEEARAAAK